MKKIVKGLAVLPVIALLAVGAAVGVGGTLLYMRMHSGGLGDGKDVAVQVNQDISVSESIPETSDIPETSESETEPETEPVTENGDYIKISVIGNDYYYDDQLCTLEEISSILHSSEKIHPVMLVNQKASKKAYDALSAVLQNEEINIIQTDENKPES